MFGDNVPTQFTVWLQIILVLLLSPLSLFFTTGTMLWPWKLIMSYSFLSFFCIAFHVLFFTTRTMLWPWQLFMSYFFMYFSLLSCLFSTTRTMLWPWKLFMSYEPARSFYCIKESGRWKNLVAKWFYETGMAWLDYYILEVWGILRASISCWSLFCLRHWGHVTHAPIHLRSKCVRYVSIN